MKNFLLVFFLLVININFSFSASSGSNENSNQKTNYEKAVSLINSAKNYEKKGKIKKAEKRYQKAQKLLIKSNKALRIIVLLFIMILMHIINVSLIIIFCLTIVTGNA